MLSSFFQIEELRIQNYNIIHILRETNIYGVPALSWALCLVINILTNPVM